MRQRVMMPYDDHNASLTLELRYKGWNLPSKESANRVAQEVCRGRDCIDGNECHWQANGRNFGTHKREHSVNVCAWPRYPRQDWKAQS